MTGNWFKKLSAKLRDSKRLSSWHAMHTAVLVVAVLFLGMMAWSAPGYTPAQTATAQASATLAVAEPARATATRTLEPGILETPTPAPQVVIVVDTPIPQEWAENKELTHGIVVGGVVMVMIVVGGTLSAIRRRM